MAIQGLYQPGANPSFVSVCIYGRGGTGKTTLLKTMNGRGLVLDVPLVEGGTYVLKSQAGRIDIAPIEKWEDIAPAYKELLLGKTDYKWVAVDSITGFTSLAILKVTHGRTGDAAKITLPEWGTVGRLVGQLVYDFRKLKMHTIWLAQERQFGSEGEPKVVGPDTSPAARQILLPALTLIGRLYTEYDTNNRPQRLLRVNPHPDFDAKTRAAEDIVVPDVVKNFHMSNFLKYAIYGQGQPPEAMVEGDFALG